MCYFTRSGIVFGQVRFEGPFNFEMRASNKNKNGSVKSNFRKLFCLIRFLIKEALISF